MVNNPVGFWKRLLALFIDGVFLALVISLFEYIFLGEIYLTKDKESYFELLSLFYIVLLPVYWSGYTIGKRVVGIRIVRIDGKRVGVGTMLMRQVVSGIIYGITFGIAYIASILMVVAGVNRRAIHDFIAKTYVTSDPVEENVSR